MFTNNIISLRSRYLVAVAFVLSACTAGATNYFGGLLNFPLGSAALSQSGGGLIVSGLDAGGSNGLAIALGPGGRGWRGEFDGPIILRMGDGMEGTSEFYPTPTVDARTDIVLPANPSDPGIKIEAVTQCYICPRKPGQQPEIPMGQMKIVVFGAMDQIVDTLHIENGVSVHLPLCTSNQVVALAALAFLDYGYGQAAWHYYFSEGLCLKPPAGKSYPPITHLAVQFSGLSEDESLFSLLPGASRIIKLLPKQNAGGPTAGQLRLSAEYLQQFGHLHQALGQAQFDARPDALAVNNLDSAAGGDGVAIHLGPNNNRLKVRWDGLDPTEAAPPGASFTMAARGSFTGGVKQMLGSMKVQKLATGMALVNDFTSIGSQSALILVMRNGAQVASFRLNHNTPLPFTGGWPSGGTIGPRLTEFSPPYGPICFYEDWPIDVTIPIPGGNVMGNQIRVLIDDVAAPFASLDAVHFTFTGLPQFVLTGEESSQAGVIFDGLVHAPLGNASLHGDTPSERLTISGIGSSGNDGVRILTGGGGGASTKLGVFKPDLLPMDAFLHWAAIDPTDIKVQELTVQRVAGGGALFADFTGLGAPAVTVALYSNDVLLAYANGIPPTAPLLTFGGGGLPFALDPCILHPEDCYGAIDIDIWQPDPIGPIGSLVTLPGSPAMRATRVLIQPDPLPVTLATIHVKEIQITGKNLGVMSLGTGFSVGVHFGANEPGPGGSALGPGDVAGAVPQANWNNAMGASGSVSSLVGDLNGVAVPTTITVEWASPNTWSSTGRGEENNGFPPGGDRRLMSGYVDTDDGGGVARVAVFGIDPITANAGYDVIVYILGGVSGRGGAYTIGGVTKYGTAAANPSAHLEDPGVDLNDTGTYVRFTGLTGSSFTLIADANNANGPFRNFRAPINGIQIVRSSHSPPEGLVYFGLEHHAVGQAQYRFDTPGTFTVDNLGINGNDGMDVQIQRLVPSSATGGPIIAMGPPRNAYFADWVALNPQPLPPGQLGELNMRAVGDWNGQPGTIIGSLSVRSSSGSPGMQLFPDFSAVGSSRQRVELLNGCTIVSTFTVDNGVPAVQMTDGISGTSLSSEPGDEPCGTMPLPPFPRPWWWSVKWSQPVDVVSPSGEHFQVDRVRLAPDDVTGSLAALSQFSYRCTGYSGLRFTRESSERRGLNFNGNQHFPLGQATLTKTAAGTLIMDNVGPSGRDGMEISLGQADYCEVASPSLPLPPPEDSCRYEYRAVLDGIADRTAAVLAMTINATGEMEFTGDMSPLGATRYTVLALNGSQEVAGVSNRPVASVAINGASLGYSTSLRWDIQRYKCFIRIKVPKLPGDPGPLIRLAPGLAVNGDGVLLLPEDPTRTLGPQNRLLLTAVAVHPEPKLFVSEQLGMFGLGHTGLGDATLDAVGGTLRVGNLGISGNDGVAIDLESSRSFLATFTSLDVPAVQVQGPFPHPWLQARAFGHFNGMPSQDLGSVRFTALSPTAVEVVADFTPVGASTHTIEVWRSGQLVQRLTGHSGPVGTLNNWPSGIGKLGGASGTPSCIWAVFQGGVRITITGGPTLEGDELRILVENPSAPIGDLQSFHLTAAGLGSFTIIDETRTLAIAPPRVEISQVTGGNLQLTIPTVFGYSYTLESVNALGPQPVPWSPVQTFDGDGSTRTIPLENPGAMDQFYRVRIDAP